MNFTTASRASWLVNLHLRDNLPYVHSFAFAPAVIVCDHADQSVWQLGFARELGFGHRRHSDDVGAPGAVHAAFGAGRKLRAFHR